VSAELAMIPDEDGGSEDEQQFVHAVGVVSKVSSDDETQTMAVTVLAAFISKSGAKRFIAKRQLQCAFIKRVPIFE
jgi:hypothetical protein